MEYSEGGRRLYCDKDIVKLHQILSMKYLGLSLDQIKNNLFKIETGEEVTQMLKAQCLQITNQIENLKSAKNAISSLIEEVVAMDKVDWSKYASIVDMLKVGDSNYWIVKHFKNKTLVSVGSRFDKNPQKILQRALRKFGITWPCSLTKTSRQTARKA